MEYIALRNYREYREYRERSQYLDARLTQARFGSVGSDARQSGEDICAES